MGSKKTILGTGLVLWVLGVLVGASAVEVIPGEFSVQAEVILIVAILASLGNLVFLHKQVP